MGFIARKHRRPEFKIRRYDEAERPENEDAPSERKKFVRLKPVDRSNYPRLLDLWPIFVVMGILLLFALFVFRFVF